MNKAKELLEEAKGKIEVIIAKTPTGESLKKQAVDLINAVLEPDCPECGDSGEKRKTLGHLNGMPLSDYIGAKIPCHCQQKPEPAGELVAKIKKLINADLENFTEKQVYVYLQKAGDCLEEAVPILEAKQLQRDEIIEDMPTDEDVGSALIIYSDTNELVPKPVLNKAAARIAELEKEKAEIWEIVTKLERRIDERGEVLDQQHAKLAEQTKELASKERTIRQLYKRILGI